MSIKNGIMYERENGKEKRGATNTSVNICCVYLPKRWLKHFSVTLFSLFLFKMPFYLCFTVFNHPMIERQIMAMTPVLCLPLQPTSEVLGQHSEKPAVCL